MKTNFVLTSCCLFAASFFTPKLASAEAPAKTETAVVAKTPIAQKAAIKKMIITPKGGKSIVVIDGAKKGPSKTAFEMLQKHTGPGTIQIWFTKDVVKPPKGSTITFSFPTTSRSTPRRTGVMMGMAQKDVYVGDEAKLTTGGGPLKMSYAGVNYKIAKVKETGVLAVQAPIKKKLRAD